MKASIENRDEFRIEKIGLLRTATPAATTIKPTLDHQTALDSVLRAERKKAEAITLLRSHPQIY